MNDKTVYILGAGFSILAGAPPQSKLIEKIFDLPKYYPKPEENKALYSWINQLETFLREDLHVSDAERTQFALEDVYTPIDKAILESTSFRSYTPQKLLELRENINKLIKLAVRETIKHSTKDDPYVKKFAEYVVELSKERSVDDKLDKISIITTNWDITVDNATYKIVKDKKPLGVVDYCCYTDTLDEKDETIKPGLYALGKGGFNVKILKLHGSLNWLQCPKCQRLFAQLYNEFPGGNVTTPFYCRYCETNFNQNKDDSNLLVSNMIMPTFLKNINNVQNKLIWQNAGIELSEASKVVFIGYSLPYADFEFKQLLSKMIRADAKIEVVLFKNDNPGNCDVEYKHLTAGYRYLNFFSGRNLSNKDINYDGVINYVNKL